MLPRTQELGIEFVASDRGLEIAEVRSHSPAERIGLEAGDVIVTIYGFPATNAAVWEWLQSEDVGYVRLGIWDPRRRKLVTRYVNLTADEPVAAAA